jgi:mono/diheme cytochrome c family protein
MSFKRAVNVVEVLVLIGTAIVVLLLFTNEPDSTSAGPQTPGAQVFAASCARCHGADGSGGTGPQLSQGAVVQDFPDVADEIAFVTKGRGSMPSFGGQLSPGEIRQVVDFTRTL